eukprot:jgi/Chlat1/5765/Chrsp387S05501
MPVSQPWPSLGEANPAPPQQQQRQVVRKKPPVQRQQQQQQHVDEFEDSGCQICLEDEQSAAVSAAGVPCPFCRTTVEGYATTDGATHAELDTALHEANLPWNPSTQATALETPSPYLPLPTPAPAPLTATADWTEVHTRRARPAVATQPTVSTSTSSTVASVSSRAGGNAGRVNQARRDLREEMLLLDQTMDMVKREKLEKKLMGAASAERHKFAIRCLQLLLPHVTTMAEHNTATYFLQRLVEYASTNASALANLGYRNAMNNLLAAFKPKLVALASHPRGNFAIQQLINFAPDYAFLMEVLNIMKGKVAFLLLDRHGSYCMRGLITKLVQLGNTEFLQRDAANVLVNELVSGDAVRLASTNEASIVATKAIANADPSLPSVRALALKFAKHAAEIAGTQAGNCVLLAVLKLHHLPEVLQMVLRKLCPRFAELALDTRGLGYKVVHGCIGAEATLTDPTLSGVVAGVLLQPQALQANQATTAKHLELLIYAVSLVIDEDVYECHCEAMEAHYGPHEWPEIQRMLEARRGPSEDVYDDMPEYWNSHSASSSDYPPQMTRYPNFFLEPPQQPPPQQQHTPTYSPRSDPWEDEPPSHQPQAKQPLRASESNHGAGLATSSARDYAESEAASLAERFWPHETARSSEGTSWRANNCSEPTAVATAPAAAQPPPSTITPVHQSIERSSRDIKLERSQSHSATPAEPTLHYGRIESSSSSSSSSGQARSQSHILTFPTPAVQHGYAQHLPEPAISNQQSDDDELALLLGSLGVSSFRPPSLQRVSTPIAPTQPASTASPPLAALLPHAQSQTQYSPPQAMKPASVPVPVPVPVPHRTGHT